MVNLAFEELAGGALIVGMNGFREGTKSLLGLIFTRNNERSGQRTEECFGRSIRSVLDTGMNLIDGGAKMKPQRDELSPEERAELHKMLEETCFGRRRPRRPMLICEGGEVIREAEVNVSPFDPNWRVGGKIEIKR